MNWLKKLFNIFTSRTSASDIAEDLSHQMRDIESAGAVDDGHYTDCVEAVKQLKREGRNKDAIEILLKCVDATESESKRAGKGWGVAPWYYEQLAILYRKEKEYAKEVEVLERYANQEKAPGASPAKLAERLIKARALNTRNGT